MQEHMGGVGSSYCLEDDFLMFMHEQLWQALPGWACVGHTAKRTLASCAIG